MGSAIQKKAETVVYVERENETVRVSPEYTSNYTFEEFAFRINEEGLPEYIFTLRGLSKTNTMKDHRKFYTSPRVK